MTLMLSITPADEKDLPAIADLLEEMDRFYGVTEFESSGKRRAQIQAAIFRGRPAAYLLLARDSEQVVGVASYSFLWPAVGLTKSLFLKELYVAADARRRGVGGMLMDYIFDLAAETGCSRVEWTTDRANAEAQRFYEQIGARTESGKVFYRVQETMLSRRSS
jgi:GNAT superfamily N-acetyltransferase